MTLSNFIKKRKYLVWYVKDPDKNLDADSILEHTLNYGDWDDVQTLFKIIGIKTAAKIFREKIKLPRCNYDDKVKNYFQLYFDKYA